MRSIRFLSTIVLLASANLHASEAKTYIGIVTDTMCEQDHTAMKVSPNEKCVRECGTERVRTHSPMANTSTF
jgi:hypothetical protein